MSDPAFDLYRLRIAVAELQCLPPESLAADRDEIAEQHEQLGRLLNRLPVQHKEAAE